MANTPIVGFATQLRWGASAITAGYEFISETLKGVPKIDERQGIRGVRATFSHQFSKTQFDVKGQLNFEPTKAFLQALLMYILGGTPVTTTYPLAETVPDCSWETKKGAKYYLYAGCKTSKATFKASKGGILELAMDIVGKTETIGDSGSSATIDVGIPFVMAGSTIVVAGATYPIDDFELEIDNGIIEDFFANSLTRTQTPEGPRKILLKITPAYTSESHALLASVLATPADVAASATFVDAAANALVFTMGHVVPIEGAVETKNKKDALMLPMTFQASAESTDAELVTTLTA